METTDKKLGKELEMNAVDELKQLFGRNVDVLNEDENLIREIMGERGYKSPERVKELPATWWEEEVQMEFITNKDCVGLLNLLKDNKVEWTRIRLWHLPHEKDERPTPPEDVEIDWSSILKVLGVVAGAVVTTIMFIGAIMAFALISAFGMVDPWCVIDLPSGIALKVYEWED